MQDELSPPPAKRADRHSVSLRGYALSADRDVDISVSDMSYSGCLIRSGETFTPGELIELRIIGRGGAHARVRWASDGVAGVEFVGG